MWPLKYKRNPIIRRPHSQSTNEIPSRKLTLPKQKNRNHAMLPIFLKRPHPKRHVEKNSNPHKQFLSLKLIRLQQCNLEPNQRRRHHNSLT